MKLEIKQKAIQMRREGKTYSEIQTNLGQIPKGTLSNWLRGIVITPDQQKRIIQRAVNKMDLGRKKSAQTNHRKRMDRIKGIQFLAEREYLVINNDPLFHAGLLLYLAEGSKKFERFQFMNSDPNLIKFMILWLKKIGKIKKADLSMRLYIHKIYAAENNENFWSKELCVPRSQFKKTVYKPSIHKVKKNPLYRGCIRIEVGGSVLYWKIMRWRDMFYKTL